MMQLQTDKSNRFDEIKTQFRAREGYYRLMNSPDYSQRSQRAMGFSTGTTNSNSSATSNEKTCIKISLVSINDYNDSITGIRRCNSTAQRQSSFYSSQPKGARDKKICFNVGRELFVYNYDGVRAGPDASNPIYKRSYKASAPTCHDFNQATATSKSISLLVGFSHGQVQLIDLNGSNDPDACKEFNVERLIDKTRVTCVKWLPNSPSLFLVAHASGQLYLYKDDLPCGPSAPTYQLYKQSDGVAVYTCKTKTTRNPIYKWTIGTQSASPLHEFAFSPCAKYLACVSQDGFLRVYCYDTMELVGRARSYYGGLSCVCWSPDGKYVVTGGEDDLITVWSFLERRVVARGMGHKSWVSVVAFDNFYTGFNLRDTDVDDEEDEDDKEVDDRDLEIEVDEDEYEEDESRGDSVICDNSHNQDKYLSATTPTSYRFGSVGQDTQLCLWDLSDDLLRQQIAKPKINSITSSFSRVYLDGTQRQNQDAERNGVHNTTNETPDTALDHVSLNRTSDRASGLLNTKGGSLTKTFSLVGKKDRRTLSLRSSDRNSNSREGTNVNTTPSRLIEDPERLLGTPICPQMHEVPVLEPSVCKKISFERLTSLIFCKGGFITSCQDGYVFSWARPSRRLLRGTPGQSNEELRVIDVGTSSAV